ncbi:MAG: hypothetical protein AABW80_01690 [Nanoarchaeota archaeon]
MKKLMSFISLALIVALLFVIPVSAYHSDSYSTSTEKSLYSKSATSYNYYPWGYEKVTTRYSERIATDNNNPYYANTKYRTYSSTSGDRYYYNDYHNGYAYDRWGDKIAYQQVDYPRYRMYGDTNYDERYYDSYYYAPMHSQRTGGYVWRY